MLRAMAEAPVELIKRVPLFADLDDRELKQIAASMKQRTFNAGETVTEEGKGGIGFFVIDDGTASVSVGGADVRKLGQGDYFGEIGLIADIDRTATITAESDLRCYGMTSWDFRPLVETNASIAWKMLQVMAARLKEAQTR
jgi:CRP-like cAMP-binding protein